MICPFLSDELNMVQCIEQSCVLWRLVFDPDSKDADPGECAILQWNR